MAVVDASMDGEKLELVGIGSMVLDRLHRTRRVLGPNEKGLLESMGDDGPVRSCVGGVLLNQLGWAALFDLRCGLFGRQAEDAAGRTLRAAMRGAGIETHLDLTGSATSLAEIFVDERGERAIYMAAGATAETTPRHVREDHADFIARGAVLTTEISQLPLDATLEALRVAHEHGATTVVDLDVLPGDAVGTLGDRATLDAVLRATDFLKPNASAARELFPEIGSLEDLALAIRAEYDIDTVVLTDGARGALLCDAQGARWSAAYGVDEVVDTTGAGDAFLGGLLAGRALGLELDDAVRLGHACGAACVERLGAFPEVSAQDALRRRVLALYDGTAPDDPRWAVLCEASSEEPAPGSAGRRVLEVAAEELAALAERHDGVALQAAAELIEASEAEGGRVHVTGVGKPEHVAHYAASLLSSTGTPATFLHATESLHGSLGQIVPGDVVIAISNSGTTSECLLAVEAIRGYGGKLIAVTGGLDSPLAEAAAVTLDAGVTQEGGPLGLAPRASVAAEILVLAALGAILQARRQLDRVGYAARHPAGALGRQARGD
jgi:arabinose-5-phosphate isomerase